METFFLCLDLFEIISGIGLLNDLKSLQIVRLPLVYSGTVTKTGFNANKDCLDLQLICKSKVP